MKIILLAIGLLMGSRVWARWDLNDVSYLMPLPQSASSSGLLTEKSVGALGVLLPVVLLENMPRLNSPPERVYTTQGMQAVSLRIDPCFPLPTPRQCQKQIRIVWQPIEVTPLDEIRAVDASMHSFYVLNDSQFLSLLKDLQNWKKKYAVQTQGLPLQLHPAWTQDSDPSLRDFNQLILKYVGEKNLSRLTAMALRNAGVMWGFTGIDIAADGSAQSLVIPRVNARVQNIVNTDFPFEEYTGGFAPRPQGTDTIILTPRDSRALTPEPQEIIRELGAAYRIEDPRRYSPENMDCVSCHLASSVLNWGFKKHGRLQLDQVWRKDIYQNERYNLKNTSPAWKTNNFRAFGYFSREAFVSQRVINESAEVAQALDQLMPVFN